MGKQRLRALDHRAGQQQSEDLHPDSLVPQPMQWRVTEGSNDQGSFREDRARSSMTEQSPPHRKLWDTAV